MIKGMYDGPTVLVVVCGAGPPFLSSGNTLETKGVASDTDERFPSLRPHKAG